MTANPETGKAPERKAVSIECQAIPYSSWFVVFDDGERVPLDGIVTIEPIVTGPRPAHFEATARRGMEHEFVEALPLLASVLFGRYGHSIEHTAIVREREEEGPWETLTR